MIKTNAQRKFDQGCLNKNQPDSDLKQTLSTQPKKLKREIFPLLSKYSKAINHSDLVRLN